MFGASVTALKAGRGMAALDAAHLRGDYKGKVLRLMGYDAEDGRFTIGIALVPGEDTESCTWFLNILKRAGVDTMDLFITDRGPALEAGIDNVYGGALTRADRQFCVKHMERNISDNVSCARGGSWGCVH